MPLHYLNSFIVPIIYYFTGLVIYPKLTKTNRQFLLLRFLTLGFKSIQRNLHLLSKHSRRDTCVMISLYKAL